MADTLDRKLYSLNQRGSNSIIKSETGEALADVCKDEQSLVHKDYIWYLIFKMS